MISATEALEKLKSGNERYVKNQKQRGESTDEERRGELIDSQDPIAVILGCSDSRVPAEIIFDQGLGDLFVIRVAGNIVAPSQIGSVEYAIEKFNTRLIVVLGHTNCGAVISSIEQLEKPPDHRSPNLYSIVSRIRPSVEILQNTGNTVDRELFVGSVIRANILASVNHLSHGSKIIEHSVINKHIEIVGAEYSLKTGEVDFFYTL